MGNDGIHAFATQVDVEIAVKDHQLVEGDGGAAVEFGDHGFADQALAGIQGNGDISAHIQAVFMHGSRVKPFRGIGELYVNGRGAVLVADQLGRAGGARIVDRGQVIGDEFYRVRVRIRVKRLDPAATLAMATKLL